MIEIFLPFLTTMPPLNAKSKKAKGQYDPEVRQFAKKRPADTAELEMEDAFLKKLCKKTSAECCGPAHARSAYNGNSKSKRYRKALMVSDFKCECHGHIRISAEQALEHNYGVVDGTRIITCSDYSYPWKE